MVSQSTSLNDLPDDILTHILSFLPIKEAFRTSILSKRWGPFCYSLPVLHFQSDNIQTNDWIPLRRLIDKVMFSPLAHHVTLKSFHLNCRYIHFHDAKAECLPFHDWIEEAKRRFLKELRLSFITHIPLKPTTFFCSKTLIVLKLMDIVISTMLHCSVDLPLLKTLDLSFVTFQDMEDVMKLISGCPILEKLRTLDVKATSGVTLGGYYKPLSKLIKANIHLFEVPLRAVYNVKFLTIWKMEKCLSNQEISSYYKGFPVFEYLTKLVLHWLHSNHHIHDWNEVVKMLQNCPKLQTLNIEKARNLTTKEDWKYPDHVPECVSSHLTKCAIIYCEVIADFRFAKYILQNASLLRVMKIYSAASDQVLEEGLISCLRISLACKLSLI